MSKYLPYLIIIFVCIITFWQVAFLRESLKYDILDGYLPGHFFTSDCLRNNVFPLWNPYMELGFPQYADMINTNYLVNIVIGRIFPYTNITFHILFIFYIIIAGTGAYKLSKALHISDSLSLLAGISFSLSGFITGNAQHIQFIIGAAWLPFVLLFFIKIFRETSIKNTLLFVIFAMLLISGGYPSFAILLAYILGFLYLYFLVRYIRENKIKQAVSFSGHCILAMVLLLLLCGGIFVSIWQSTPYVGRYVKLGYGMAITNPFTPRALISLIAPLVTASHAQLFHTDLSMNNHYYGVIMVVLLVYGLFRRQSLTSILILAAGILILFLSFGEYSFVHKLFYEHVPLFNKFRHPASFRFLTILFLLLFTGIQTTRHDPLATENFSVFRKTYLFFTLVIFIICIGSAGVIVKMILGPVDFKLSLTSLINDYGIFGPLFVQSAILLIINSFFFYFILIREKLTWFYPLLIVTLGLEMFIFTQINMRYTVTSDYNPMEIRAFLRNRPAGFPLPDQHLVAENTDISVASVPVWINTNIYAKTVSPYFLYPFYLNGYRRIKEDSLLFNNIINNRLLYFCDTVLPVQKIQGYDQSVIRNLKCAFVADSIYKNAFNNLRIKRNIGDSIACIYFSPLRIKFSTKSETPQVAVLLQNNYPGWDVFIDGKKTDHFTINRSFIGIILPAGNHEVSFTYKNPLYKNASLLSFALLLILIFLVLFIVIFENRKSSWGYIYTGLAILLVITVIALLKPVIPFEKKQKAMNGKICAYLQKTVTDRENEKSFLLFNTESSLPFDQEYSGNNVSFQRFRLVTDAINLSNMLDTLKAEKLIYIWSNVIEIPEMRQVMQMHFPVISKQYCGERFAVIEYSKGPMLTIPDDHINLNNFETSAPLWSTNGVILDSNTVFAGKFSEKLSEDHPFSSTFRYTVDHVPSPGIRVFSTLRFRLEGNQSCHLVISINRKGKTFRYDAIDLSAFNSHKNGWNTGFASQQWLRGSLRKGDEIVVYCWNSGKNEKVFIDDFLVKIE